VLLAQLASLLTGLGTPLVLNPPALDRLGLTLCLAQRFSLPLRRTKESS